MDLINNLVAEREKARVPYSAPVVTVVLHHSQTRTLNGNGFDGGLTTGKDKS